MMFIFIITAPTSSPPNFTALKNRTHDSLDVQWKPLATNITRGDLTGYKLTWFGKESDSHKASVTLHPSLTKYQLNSLQTNTLYILQLQAVNENGEGPFAEIEESKSKDILKFSTFRKYIISEC